MKKGEKKNKVKKRKKGPKAKMVSSLFIQSRHADVAILDLGPWLTTRKANGREVIRTKVGSGACEPAINPETAADYPIEETEASKKGVAVVSASGDPMPQLGQRTFVVKTPSGALMSFKNQVCHCTGPLTSVAKMVDADNCVGFSTAGSFIMNTRTGAIDWMERKDDGFELELEVLPYTEAAPLLKKAGFQGQP